uniref:Dilute domain-containing protein n=1 Tax=Panagrolaimus sp. JU765 TaxID=591449 RepID=A0AC34R4W4_9BILA
MAEFETDIGIDIDDGFHSTTSSGVVVQTPTKPDFYKLTFEIDDDDEDFGDDNSEDSTEAENGSATTTITTGIDTKILVENMVQICIPYYLEQKLKRQNDELNELRAQLRGYAGIGDNSKDLPSIDSSTLRLTSLHRNQNHNGMLNIFDVTEFTRILIYDLKPRVSKQLIPGLPSYLLLAGIRFFDRENDDVAITSLFKTAHSLFKDLSNSADTDLLIMWLVNLWKLLNLLRQYSGENNDEWTKQNTEQQNLQKILNFNLEPIRHQISLKIQNFYESFMKKAIDNEVLSKKILAAILQHDSSQHLSSTGIAHVGLTRQPSKDITQHALDDLLSFLSMIYEKLKMFGADRILIGQVFWQITHWICCQAMNNLVYRKDLCKFEKAIQIKHNVSEVQNWLYKHDLGELRSILEPLVQACHLLQSRKDEGNLDTLCGEMTSLLLPKQVVNILIRYTPTEEFEEDPISKDFIDRVEVKLVQRLLDEGKDVNVLKDRVIVPGSFLEPFNTEPFVYSDFALESLTLPTCLHLRDVCRLA